MFVPLPLLIPMAIVATLAMIGILAVFHLSMRDYGRCLFGRIDLTMPKNLMLERWCVLYFVVHEYRGCHSLSTAFD